MIYEPQDRGLESPDANQAAVDEIVSRGPTGTIALAGVAVLIVVAIWIAFYAFVFVPRN
jgi:hypothetical protein